MAEAFDLLSRRVSLFFDGNAAWYDGTINDYNANESSWSAACAAHDHSSCSDPGHTPTGPSVSIT